MAYNSKLDTSTNEIRLLHLSPGCREEDVITCHFSSNSLDVNTFYEALSYVWGDPDHDVEIIVEEKPFKITPNLHTALQHLRLPDKERVLWIDALCINQDDIEERTHQVSRMSSIYGHASMVVVWLGPAWEGCEMAMDFFQILGEDDKIHLRAPESPYVEVSGYCLRSTKLTTYIHRYLQLPWWFRTWTVQEFLLAKDLVFQCGKRVLPRTVLLKASRMFWNHHFSCCQALSDADVSISDSMQPLSKLGYIIDEEVRPDLLYIISDFRGNHVTDPRDRIYGMLGLSSGELLDIISPDYSLSWARVSADLVIKCIEKTGSLDIFSHILGEVVDESDPDRIPTFAPTWACNSSWSEVVPTRSRHVAHYRANDDTKAILKVISPYKISLKGRVFDTIIAKGNLSPFEISYNEFIEEVREVATAGDITLPGIELEVSIMQTLCGDLEMVQKDLDEYVSRFKTVEALTYSFEKWGEYSCLPAPVPDGEIRRFGRRYERVLSSIAAGRRFVKTSKGNLGFVPENCQVGDSVVVLAGGSVPYVIRPVQIPSREDGDNVGEAQNYTILGDCYVDKIMDGQVFWEVKYPEQELDDIILV